MIESLREQFSFQKRQGLGLEAPRSSSDKLVGWRSSGVSIRMPVVRDAWLGCYRVPLKREQRPEADQRKQFLAPVKYLLRQILQNCVLPAGQEQRFLHFLMFHQIKIRAIFWSSTLLSQGSLRLGHPRDLGDSKTNCRAAVMEHMPKPCESWKTGLFLYHRYCLELIIEWNIWPESCLWVF